MIATALLGIGQAHMVAETGERWSYKWGAVALALFVDLVGYAALAYGLGGLP